MLVHGLLLREHHSLRNAVLAMQGYFQAQVQHFVQRAMLVHGLALLERHQHFNAPSAMEGCFQPCLVQQVTLFVTHVLLGGTV
jgi:hypothetical protein